MLFNSNVSSLHKPNLRLANDDYCAQTSVKIKTTFSRFEFSCFSPKMTKKRVLMSIRVVPDAGKAGRHANPHAKKKQ